MRAPRHRSRGRLIVLAAALLTSVGALIGSNAAAEPPGASSRATRQAATPDGDKLADPLASSAPEFAPDGDRIVVEIVLDPDDDTAPAAVPRAVVQAGGVVTGSVAGMVVQADVPLSAVPVLDALPGVATVRHPLPQDLRLAGDDDRGPDTATLGPFLQAVTGDEIGHTNAGAWHAAGHVGAGVRIGIVDAFHGPAWEAAVASGDLPSIGTERTFCVIAGNACDAWATGLAHGVAVAEIVHEVAPGAELYLATALTAADLAAALQWFIENDVTIVNRSLGAALDGPGDGTGPLGAIADQAVAAGIAWFNSAGNAAGRDGRQGDYYRATFTDTDGDGWHEFVNPWGPAPSGAPVEEVAMDCEGVLLSSLRWDDWDDLAGATDYDLFAFSKANPNRYRAGYGLADALADPSLVDAAYDDQGAGGAPPLEHLSGSCSGDAVYVAIRRFDASSPAGDTLELMAEADLRTWTNPYSAGYPIVDSTNPGVFAIGSVDGDHTIAYYSSEGPTNDGRVKPDFTARSGIRTNTLPTFHGTSASSPTAAGLAALVIGAGRATTPSELREWFVAHATDDLGRCGADTVFGLGELVLPSPDGTASAPAPSCASRFEPIAPVRVLDTRPDQPGPGPKGQVAAEHALDVQFPGGLVPDDAVAVALNVTVTGAAGPGYVTAYPAGTSRPLASAVNVTDAAQTRAAFTTVPLGDGGRVTLFTKSAADLVVDLAGYYARAQEPTAAGRFVALTPARLFDTRAPGGVPLTPGAALDVEVLGRAGVPPAGVAAVVVNVTGTEASAAGYLTAFPAGAPRPLASNVNLAAPGATAANLAIVPLGSGGRISVVASHGAHALADVVGYITDGSAAPATAGLYVPLVPTRVLDTRGGAPIAADAAIEVPVGGLAGVPPGASAVSLSVAGVDGPPGYLTVWDAGVARPLASTLNLDGSTGDTRANGAMLRLGAGGRLAVYAKHGGHVLVDVTGYFLG